MNKALSSFVIISNSLNNGQDSISAFVPFMVRLFDIKNYNKVDIETICTDFASEYGIQIPRYPTETILNRMKPHYLTKAAGKIQVNRDEIKKSTEKIDFESENRKYNALLEHFIDFCQDYQVPIEVSREEADALFTGFLKDHDLDIIFAIYFEEQMTVIADNIEIKDPDKIFLLNKYINLLLQRNDEYAEYLLDSAIGHKYASLILYREFSNIRGKGVCANYYLDIGIIFDLTGINKPFRKKAAEDFLSMLRGKGSKLWIFPHNREEFLRIIEGCLNWIENDYYDPAKASRALQHFKDLGFGIEEVQLFINQFEDVLDTNGIKVASALDPNLHQEFQIDTEELQKIILDVYNSNGHKFDVEYKERTLERDIKSIEDIYKLRMGHAPINLNETTHVFVTTNPGLAYAASKYDRIENNRGYFSIPVILTDTFVGTVVWIQEPARLVKEFNRSKLISYTNAVIQPRATVMTRFAQEIERARINEIEPLSDESAQLLLTGGLARKLLADKTLGDADRITDQTPYEIIVELKAVLVAEEKKKTDEEKKKAEAALRDSKESLIQKEIAERERIAAQKQNRLQAEHIQRVIDKVALWSKRGFIIVFAIMALIFFWKSEFQDPKTTALKLVNVAIAVFSALSGVTVFALGDRVQNWIRTNLHKALIPDSEKLESSS